MKVERLDIFDFKVTLTESEFNGLKQLAEYFDDSCEDIVSLALDRLLDTCVEDLERKE